MPSLSLLSKTTLTFTRYDTLGTLVSGKFVESVDTTDFDAKGNLQPFSKGRTSVKLPEGLSTRDAKVFYTNTSIKPADQRTGLRGDYTTIDGYVWDCYDVEDYNDSGLCVDNFAVYLVRNDNDHGG